jgi:hypothetical protein
MRVGIVPALAKEIEMELDTRTFSNLTDGIGIESLIGREMGSLRIEDIPAVLLNVDHEEMAFITELRQLGEEYDATGLIGVECCHRCKSHDDVAYRGNGKVSRPMCGECFMKQEGDRLRNYRAVSFDDQLYYKRKYDLDIELAYTQGGNGRNAEVLNLRIDNVTPSSSAGFFRNPGITRKVKK